MFSSLITCYQNPLEHAVDPKKFAENTSIVHKLGGLADTAVAVTLLILGSLAAAGVLSWNPAVSYAFIGVGSAMAFIFLQSFLARCVQEARGKGIFIPPEVPPANPAT